MATRGTPLPFQVQYSIGAERKAGGSVRIVAARLGISTRTVQKYTKVYRKITTPNP